MRQIIFGVQVLMAAVALAGGNLLVNPRFETDGLGGSLNWAFEREPERLAGQGPKGETAMRVRSLSYQRGFKAVTGEKYRFSAWVRSHNCPGRLLVVNGRWWWQELSADIPADTHGEWKRIEKTGVMVSLGPVNVPVPDGTVGPAQFCVQPSPKGDDAYIDFCDPQVEPLSELAVAKSAPADAVAKLPTRLVPVDPLLDEVDSADAKLRFFYSGDLAKDPTDYEIAASLDGGTPVRQAMDAKREATVAFGAIAAGRHQVTVRLFEKGSSAALKENAYPVTARPRRPLKVAGRRLNNLVTEIANRTLADGEYEFVNPREGWVYVGFDGRYAKARAFVDRGTEPVIRFREGERSETMRYLSKGLHTLLVTGVRGDAKAEAGRFTIRLVKTLYNRSLDFKADRTDYANYQYRADYYRRWIYGSFNTIAFYQDWQCSPKEVVAEEAEFGPRGVRIFRQIDCSPTDVKLRSDPKRLAALMENSPSYRDGYELSMDETGFRTTPRAGIANWGEYLWSTVERRLPQPMHQWWCDIPMYVPRNRQLLVSPFAANVNSGGGRGLMLLETYHGTYPDEAKVDRELDCLKQYYRSLGEMVPSAPARTLPLFGGFLTLGHFCNAAYPEGDIKGVYDKFMHAVATDPAFAEVGGIGVTGYYCDEELPRFLARAIRHYAIEGRTDRFGERYGITSVPGILNGGDFGRGLEDWTVSAAEKGSVATGTNRSLGGGYQQRVCAQGGTWNTYALFVRSDRAPNRISRKISGLVKGRLYALQFCTADRDDLLKPGKFPKDWEFRAEVKGAETVDALHLVRKWPFEAWQFKIPKVTFITERLVFRAVSDTAEIVFSDWKDDAKHVRPSGEGRILNYVGVRPYFVEDGDFDDLVGVVRSAQSSARIGFK